MDNRREVGESRAFHPFRAREVLRPNNPDGVDKEQQEYCGHGHLNGLKEIDLKGACGVSLCLITVRIEDKGT